MAEFYYRVDYTETCYGVETLRVEAKTRDEADALIAEHGYSEFSYDSETVDWDNFMYTDDTLEFSEVVGEVKEPIKIAIGRIYIHLDPDL